MQRDPSDLLPRALEALRARDQALWTFLAAVPGLAVVLDAGGRVVYANPRFLELTARRPDETLGRDWVRTFQAPEDTEAARGLVPAPAGGWMAGRELVAPLMLRDARRHLVRWVAMPLPDGHGGVATTAFVGEDLSGEQERWALGAQLAVAVDLAADIVIITDPQGSIGYVNPAFERTTGYAAAQVIGGNPRILRSGEHPPELYQAMWWTITRGQTWRGELVNRRADGSLFVAETSIVPVRDRHGMTIAYVGVQRDVSPMRELRSSLDNTRKQRERLAGSLERIVLKDSVDETCADLAAVLVEIPGVMVGGIGLVEDEGGVRLAAALPGRLRASVDIPPAAAERACHPDTGPWIEAVAAMPAGPRASGLATAGVGALLYLPVRQEGATLAVLVAGGADRQGADIWAQLLALGEVAAVLRAVVGPSASPLQLRRRRRAWIGRLIEEDAFRPVFQPIRDMVTGRIAGFEALTRFADGTSPATVFAEAEACGLGQPLELATLAASIRASAELPRGAWLGINVSSELLHRGAEVRELVRSARREIVVEITHQGTPDYEAARAIAEHLAPDIRIAVDDTVGGAADFRHLVDLRPDFVKLGRDLVQGIEHDLGRQAVVAGLKQFSQVTGGGLIAEGVETPEEHAMLVKLGVPFGQGYHLGRPAPAPEWRAAAGVAGVPGVAAARH